jgi:hypothetical protein
MIIYRLYALRVYNIAAAMWLQRIVRAGNAISRTKHMYFYISIL